MEIDVRKVPLREADMTPYEIMLSESQERMLCIAKAGSEQEVIDIFRKWELNAAVIGFVTNDGLVRVKDSGLDTARDSKRDAGKDAKKDSGIVVAEVPARALTHECPTYYLETQEPQYISELQSFDLASVPEPTNYDDVLTELLDSPSIASKRWVTDQFDSMVQTQTVHLPGADAAILRIRGSKKGIAVKLDGNGRFGYLDPFVGGQIAVAEAARNVACVGARPAAITDNLNFANPEKPTGFWQFRRSVEGLAEATEVLGTPVVSGNVSFYNETADGPIFPTPTIGMLGILDDVNRRCGAAFRVDAEGDAIVLLTAYDDPNGGLGGSEYLSLIHGVEAGVPPRVDLPAEKRLIDLLVECIGEGMFASCHDVSDGGLAVCLAEKAILGNQGALVLLNRTDFPTSLSPAALLFGEAQGRCVVTLRTEKQFARLKERSGAAGIRANWIGTVGGEDLRIALGLQTLSCLAVSRLADISSNAIPRRMRTALDKAAKTPPVCAPA
jgi:phosphoribosylformylglycinamidine synthase